MKTETMTPAWVVENFLPDYKERYGDYYEVDIDDDLSPDYELEYPYWIDNHFPEALWKLLEAQREVCAEVGQNGFDRECCVRQNCKHCDGCCTGEDKVKRMIANAPIPESKNRK